MLLVLLRLLLMLMLILVVVLDLVRLLIEAVLEPRWGKKEKKGSCWNRDILTTTHCICRVGPDRSLLLLREAEAVAIREPHPPPSKKK